VTGGAGFIGSNLIQRLVRQNTNLRATVHKKPLQVRSPEVEYVEADLTNPGDCRKALEGIDYVFMCAANTSGAGMIASDPTIHVTPNVIMNSLMLEAAHKEGVKKFIWISSSVVYSPSGDHPVKEDEFLAEDPYDSYFASGWMKRYTEVLCHLYSEKLKVRMPTVVLRPSNLYGPFDKFESQTSHVTAALVKKVVERQDPIVVWGDGKDVRDLLYIDDFIDAMCLAAEKIDHFDPINVASGEGHSVDEVLHTLLEIEGYTNAKVAFDRTKPSMIPVRLIDPTKAMSTLGFRAKTSLREGLEKTVEWYKVSRERL